MGTIKVGAGCIGGCKVLVGEAVKWAKDATLSVTRSRISACQGKLGEMSIRAYAAETASYRTAGMIDALLEASTKGGADRRSGNHESTQQYAVELLDPEGDGDRGAWLRDG